MIRELGIQTVISLRDSADGEGTFDDQWEAEVCRREGRPYVRLRPIDWKASDATNDRTITEFLQILDSHE